MRYAVGALFGILAMGIAAPAHVHAQDAGAAQDGRGPRFLYARTSSSQPQEVDASSVPQLRRRISLNFEQLERRKALAEVAKVAGLEFVYSDNVLPVDGNVRLVAESITVAAALTEVLLDAGVDVILSPTGTVVLVKRNAPKLPPPTAIISGRVVDSIGRQAISGALVGITGTSKRVLSDDRGRYLLSGIEAGTRSVYARRLGFRSQNVTLTLREGQDTTVDFVLVPTPSILSDVVTTGSGERDRLEVGNSIATIKADSIVANNSIQNLSDLLANRAPGLEVISGTGAVGSPSRIRIRGINSINASNDPIILIDGIRMAASYSTCRDGNLGGCNQLPSRIDDIDPSIIESIDIMKGPAASALWGADAANGVIVIKTKRGQVGPTRWTLLADQGFAYESTDFRVPTQGLGQPVNGGAIRMCSFLDQAAGLCVPVDSVLGGFNRYDDPRTTGVATGRTNAFNVDVSGGLSAIQYYLAAGYKSILGTSKLPEIDQKIISQGLGTSLPDWMKRPNSQTNSHFDGRMTGQLGAKADYSIGANFIQLFQRNGPDPIQRGYTDLRSAADTFRVSNGWDQAYIERKQNVSRFIGDLTGHWRPTPWLTATGTVGRDYAFANDNELRRRNWCLAVVPCTASGDLLGRVAVGETQTFVQTANMGLTLNLPVGRSTVLRTAIGTQYSQTKFHDFNGTAADLPVGRTDFNFAAGAKTVFESSDDRATFGTYIDQSVSLRDRIFLGAAARRDLGSALGTAVAPVFPKWSLSWLLSQEPFFPWKDRGVTLRLRSAFGHAGVQPASIAKFRSYSQLQRFVNPDGTFGSNYATLGGLGNADLRPERSVEREAGFELGLWDERVSLDFTSFHKFAEDAIISRPVAPSLGLSIIATQSYNVGNVLNTGTEATVSAIVIDRNMLRWSMRVGYASRRNKLVTLGKNIPFFTISGAFLETLKSDDAIVREGYPLFGRWAKPIIGYSDVNGDGIITFPEVKVGDSLVFIGGSEPKADIGIRQDIGFWNDRIHIGADLQYIIGQTQLNSYAASTRFYTLDRYRATVPLRTQACIAAAENQYDYCYFETINYLRLRNLSIGYTAPNRIAALLRAQSLAVSLLASNLAVWSKYNGVDPGLNTESAGGNRFISGPAMPQPRTWTIRGRLTY